MRWYDTLKSYFEQEQISQLTLSELFHVSFIVIDDLYHESVDQRVTHPRGPKSQFSDSEVITISWVGELMGIDSEKAWYGFVKKHFIHLFPHLPERSPFNRRRRNLWLVSCLIRHRLNAQLPVSDILIADSLPVPICAFKRAKFSNSPLKTPNAQGLQASYGYCDTKDMGTFLGFGVHLLVSYEGIPLAFSIANANIDERDVLLTMTQTFSFHLLIGDKGYVSEPLRWDLWEYDSIDLRAQKRGNQKSQYPLPVKKAIGRTRKRIESTISQLEEQFHVNKVRAKAHWGVMTRLIDKFAAFSLGAFLNLCLGRDMPALKDLAFA